MLIDMYTEILQNIGCPQRFLRRWIRQQFCTEQSTIVLLPGSGQIIENDLSIMMDFVSKKTVPECIYVYDIRTIPL